MAPGSRDALAATYPENSNIRNAPVVIEQDALALIKTSEFLARLGTISDPTTWEQVMPVV